MTRATMTCLALFAAPLLPLAACASNEEDASRPSPDPGVTIPDAGAEATIPEDANVDAPSMPCGPNVLCSVPTPLTKGYHVAMIGRSAADVWASGSRGLLMRWDGQRWTDVDSTLSDTLSSLFVTTDEVWGISGTLVMRRGLSSRSVLTLRVEEFSRSVSGIALLPSGEPYVSIAPEPELPVTTQFFAKLDFEAKTTEFLPDPVLPGTTLAQRMSVRALHLVPEEAIWLVGDSGRVARYPLLPPSDGGVALIGDGVLMPTSSQAALFAAWGYQDQLWAVGSDGAILHFDGARWLAEDSTTTATLHAVFGFAPNDIWAVGDAGTVLHFDGTRWAHVVITNYDGSLRCVWGAAPGDVWIGGEAAMFHWGALP